MRVLYIAIIGVIVLILGSVVFFSEDDAVVQRGDTDESPVYRLPASPLFASYLIDEREVQLVDGVAEGSEDGLNDGDRIAVIGEPFYGDIRGNGEEDTALLLSHASVSEPIRYLVAVAVWDEEGFLGLNAVPLDSIPRGMKISDELVIVLFNDTDTGESEGVYEYYALLGSTLREVSPAPDEDILRGMYLSTEDTQTFSVCGEDGVYWVSSDSTSFVALDAVYAERTRENGDTPLYVVVTGFETEPPSEGPGSVYTQALSITSILSVPRGGECIVSVTSPDVPSELNSATSSDGL